MSNGTGSRKIVKVTTYTSNCSFSSKRYNQVVQKIIRSGLFTYKSTIIKLHYKMSKDKMTIYVTRYGESSY